MGWSEEGFKRAKLGQQQCWEARQRAAAKMLTLVSLLYSSEGNGGHRLLIDELAEARLALHAAAALDLARQEAVRQAILSFAQAGAACVIATHDLGFARGCDQVIVLSEGRMMASGRPMDALTPEIVASVWGQASSPSR